MVYCTCPGWTVALSKIFFDGALVVLYPLDTFIEHFIELFGRYVASAILIGMRSPAPRLVVVLIHGLIKFAIVSRVSAASRRRRVARKPVPCRCGQRGLQSRLTVAFSSRAVTVPGP